MPQEFWTPQAWINGGWQADVRLSVGTDGNWAQIVPNVPQAGLPVSARRLGVVLPGVVNAHSHAFQRAMAGLTERSSGGANAGTANDFWSWRERMYGAALRITPEQMEAIATQLYSELLNGGYTHVCEFHYLHNDFDGKPYADPLEMSMALVRAAKTSGIGMTLLPVLYMHSGFSAQREGGGLKHEQRRFANTPDSVLHMAQAINDLNLPCINAGVALHSLRAVDPAALNEVAVVAAQHDWPVHIHIAEQTQEISDCIDHHGQRPVAWLLEHAPVDARWSLVHATHANPDELAGVQASGASVVLCPSTEANLGDGVFDFSTHLNMSGRWALGSDSHVTRRVSEELRLLEYSQRFVQRKRNVAGRLAPKGSSAAALFNGALAGGSGSAGRALGGLEVGQRADFFELDTTAECLLGIPCDHMLDAWIFSSPDAGAVNVHVAGQATPGSGEGSRAGLQAAMRALWA